MHPPKPNTLSCPAQHAEKVRFSPLKIPYLKNLTPFLKDSLGLFWNPARLLWEGQYPAYSAAVLMTPVGVGPQPRWLQRRAPFQTMGMRGCGAPWLLCPVWAPGQGRSDVVGVGGALPRGRWRTTPPPAPSGLDSEAPKVSLHGGRLVCAGGERTHEFVPCSSREGEEGWAPPGQCHASCSRGCLGVSPFPHPSWALPDAAGRLSRAVCPPLGHSLRAW